MAIATSLTKERILALQDTWATVAEAQAQINAIAEEARQALALNADAIAEIRNTVLPQLEQSLAENDIRVSELNDTALPDLEQALADTEAIVANLNNITVPNLQQDLASGIENSLVRPQIFFADEPPVNPDDPDLFPDDDRELQIDDVWYDTNNGYLRHRWTGTEWLEFDIPIPDLANKIRQYISPEHAIFPDAVDSGVPVTVGANITAV